MIRATPSGVEIDIRVVPRAAKTEWAGVRGGALLLRVSAPPVDDAANVAVVEFIAETLGLPSRAVRIVSGSRARQKRVRIDGFTSDALRQKVPGAS